MKTTSLEPSKSVMVIIMLTLIVGLIAVLAFFVQSNLLHNNNITDNNTTGNYMQTAQINNTNATSVLLSDTTNQQATNNLTQPTGYNPDRDYSYGDATHEALINALQDIKTHHQQHKPISEADIRPLWVMFNHVEQQGFMLPAEVMQHKTWLVSLVKLPSPQLQAQITQEQQAFKQQVITNYQNEQQTLAKDEKFQAYKAAEKRLTQEMIAKYPNDMDKASTALEKALAQVRQEIY